MKTGIVILSFIGLITLFGIILPLDYNEMDSANRFRAPSLSSPFGTDNFGRDVFIRVMVGAGHTLLTALLTVTGSAILGCTIGLISGYAIGIIDEVIMRLMDTLSSFPGILLALVLVSLLGNSGGTLIFALLILFIPGFTRIMRNGMLQYREKDFILLARIQGVPRYRIIFIHILPNLFTPLLSASVLGLSNAILAESTMSYLGLGLQPPIPSWGRMLSESQGFLINAPWCALAPGFMIMLTVLGFHFLGEGLKERAD
ncbi:MAG: ABC transporter permease [Treponema sp.]|nr:ABC transporter permease [Treponema sp.]